MARLAMVLQEDVVVDRVEEEETTVLVALQGVVLEAMAHQVAAMAQEEILVEGLVDTALLVIAMDHQAILVVEAGVVEVEVLLGEVMVLQVALVVEVEAVVVVAHQVETTEGVQLEVIMVLQVDQAVEEEGVGEEVVP